MIETRETALIGQWHTEGARVVADHTCLRIESLVSSHLVEVSRSGDGWSTLFLDPADGRLWERTFPQSQFHGGGPPSLHQISSDRAMATYGYKA